MKTIEDLSGNIHGLDKFLSDKDFNYYKLVISELAKGYAVIKLKEYLELLCQRNTVLKKELSKENVYVDSLTKLGIQQRELELDKTIRDLNSIIDNIK